MRLSSFSNVLNSHPQKLGSVLSSANHVKHLGDMT